jgi:hypothetical protein
MVFHGPSFVDTINISALRLLPASPQLPESKQALDHADQIEPNVTEHSLNSHLNG